MYKIWEVFRNKIWINRGVAHILKKEVPRPTRQAGEHEGGVAVFMLVAVDVGPVSKQQLTHMGLPLVRSMH